MTARLCEANASFSSTRSRSADVDAGAARAACAPPGPARCPSRAGRRRRRREATNAPSGSAPSSRARSSLAITSAAAPSLIPLELPGGDRAVLAERRLQRGELLGVVSGRGCSSRVDARRPGRARRRSGRPRPRPPSAAATRARTRPGPRARRPSARRRSRRSRPSTRAGTAPPSAGSGSASRASCPRRSGCRAGTRFSGFAITSGARLIDSTPPATNRSPSPAITAWQAPTTAASPEAHRRLTVTPATDSGSPASSAAIRATLRLSSPAWLAQPNQTSSISPAGDARALDRRRDRESRRGRPAAPRRARRRSGRPACGRRRGSPPCTRGPVYGRRRCRADEARVERVRLGTGRPREAVSRRAAAASSWVVAVDVHAGQRRGGVDRTCPRRTARPVPPRGSAVEPSRRLVVRGIDVGLGVGRLGQVAANHGWSMRWMSSSSCSSIQVDETRRAGAHLRLT